MLNTVIPTFTTQHRQVLFEYAVGFCIALLGGVLLTGGDQFILIISITLSIFIAYRYPIIIIIAHFLVFILPVVLMKCFDDVRVWKIMLNGININDILLGIMVAAILIRLGISLTGTLLLKRGSPTTDVTLWGLLTALCLWLLYEIIRNLDMYGLSALGEFRSHYLILALPVYIAIFFDSAPKRKALFIATLLFCLVVPILCIPLIGEVKGWSIGGKNRFFPADISLGILQGLFFCFLGNKYGYTKFPPFIQWAVTLVAILIILFDTHRSVWFSALAMFIAFVWFDKKTIAPSFAKIMGYVFLTIAVFFLASVTVNSLLGKDLLGFIVERSGDLFIFDNNSDSTWSWRIERWNMEMEKTIESPFTGLGFGGYWGEGTLLQTRAGVSPHNLYVQIFVKLGIVGLLLYLAIVARIFQKLYQCITRLKKNKDPEFVFLITGMISLIGSHTYYFAYSFDLYSFFFIGLSMAVVHANTPGTKY